ncbi:unnamed protein product [Calicophoron daubneyi]|uniref:RING-type domain-containing protein n=1 Tax=Calicophoron daubneyi TaxID=300641 RepID=A0AAV2T8H9_CALDB
MCFALYVLFYCVANPVEIRAFISVRDVQLDKSVEQFADEEARFGLHLSSDSPLTGLVVVAKPLNGCAEIIPKPEDLEREWPNCSVAKCPFISLIIRGDCPFERKVLAAENGGYSGAIIYNHLGDEIFHMSAESSLPVHIPSVMVGLTDGKKIANKYCHPSVRFIVEIYANHDWDLKVYLIPVLSLMGLFSIGVLGMCCFRCYEQRRRRLRRCLTPGQLHRLPLSTFIKTQTPDETCAICLEDFIDGDRLRTLPCEHAYHSKCIDPWLLKGRRVCPICKRPVFPRRRRRLFFRRNRPVHPSDDLENHLVSDSDSYEDDGQSSVAGDQPPQSTSYGAIQINSPPASRTDSDATETTPLLAALDVAASSKQLRKIRLSAPTFVQSRQPSDRSRETSLVRPHSSVSIAECSRDNTQTTQFSSKPSVSEALPAKLDSPIQSSSHISQMDSPRLPAAQKPTSAHSVRSDSSILIAQPAQPEVSSSFKAIVHRSPSSDNEFV